MNHTRPTGLNGYQPTADQIEAMAQRVDAAREVERKRAEAEAARTAADQATRDKAALETLTDDLRRRYLEVPGTTEASFRVALPNLLEEHARRQVFAPAPTSGLSRSDILNADHRLAR